MFIFFTASTTTAQLFSAAIFAQHPSTRRPTHLRRHSPPPISAAIFAQQPTTLPIYAASLLSSPPLTISTAILSQQLTANSIHNLCHHSFSTGSISTAIDIKLQEH
ncbi:hypothetical protein ACP275_05G067000 [Erythranthe tilingii]